jgi:RNA polymerase sigma-70 factor (ECF subfamily)
MLAAIRGGDPVAFERFFRDWYPRLAEYAAHLTASRDTAEDAVQEVFVALWRRRDALPEADKLAAYLHRAVRNRALNQLRSGQRADSLDDRNESRLGQPDTAHAAVEEEELHVALERALATLGARTREAFLLSRRQGLTYNEIATTMDISVKTVETMMGRALRALRELLAPHLE